MHQFFASNPFYYIKGVVPNRRDGLKLSDPVPRRVFLKIRSKKQAKMYEKSTLCIFSEDRL